MLLFVWVCPCEQRIPPLFLVLLESRVFGKSPSRKRKGGHNHWEGSKFVGSGLDVGEGRAIGERKGEMQWRMGCGEGKRFV